MSVQPDGVNSSPLREGFFYGWVVLAVAAFASFCSGPGQSYVFSIFNERLLEDLEFERTTLSALYAAGSFFSASMVFFIGKLVDRLGGRVMLGVIAVLMGLACWGMAQVQSGWQVLIGFSALRALGQGSLTTVSTILVAQWFVRLRGRAMALMSLGIALSNALLPPLAHFLIESHGWRGAYTLLGAGVGGSLLVLSWVLVRDRPEVMGLHPDGDAQAPEVERAGATTAPRIDRHVFVTGFFWLLAIPLAVAPFIVTALVFHQESILAERGLSREVSALIFVPFAIASAVSSLGAGPVIDRLGPVRMLAGGLVLQILSVAVLGWTATQSLAITYALLLGAANGINIVVSSVAWAHYYGRHGIGAIQGAGVLVMLMGAALAPYPMALMESVFSGYQGALIVIGCLPLGGLALLAFLKASPHH